MPRVLSYGIGLCSLLSAVVAAPPRLVVVVVFDQMRGDYLWRWEPFWEDGFQRLLAEGFVYSRCFHEHAATVTCAGHATIATGAAPAYHGIIGNAFTIECCSPRLTGCAQDTAGNPSTVWLRLPTVGDILRQHFPASRSVSLSHKARAALMMGGHAPTAVFWLDPDREGLVSAPSLPVPAWLQEWNRQHSPYRYADSVWYPILPASLAPPDSVPWEAPFPGGSQAFPHRISPEPGTFWDCFLLSPFSVEWLFSAARAAIVHEQLGTDTIPDLLWISVSTTDVVGHLFGPDSRELLELYLACDRIVGSFLRFLDSTIGRSQYVLVLSSDHGVAPIPEMLARTNGNAYPGIDAGRISVEELTLFLHRKLATAFGPRAGAWWFTVEPPLLVLHRSAIADAGVDAEAVRDSLVSWLRHYEGIGIAVPMPLRSSTAQDRSLSDILQRLLHRSFLPERAGDIVFYPKPFWVIGTEVPTTHGTPYEYDRSVPLVFFGGSIPAGKSSEPVSTEDIAPTIAAFLGLSLPTANGRVLPLRVP